jgi:predicted negative regulator of RcsB-dependent stress response
MKSEHRHELKTNELAEWLSNLPQWLKENSTSIIIITVLIIAVIGFFGWRRYDKNVLQVRERNEFTQLLEAIFTIEGNVVSAQSQGIDYSYEFINHASALKLFAESTRYNKMAALAFIKHGEILRKELQYRLGAVSEQDKQEQINNAKESYTQAMQKASSDSLLLAEAKFGLGLCAEELGNFEEAARIYNEIASNADFEGTVTIVKAKQRLDNMSEYENNVVFEPAPEQEIKVSTGPMIQLDSTDANMPAGLNVPTDSNTPIDIKLLPQSSEELPQAPDITPVPLLPEVTTNDSDANVSVE